MRDFGLFIDGRFEYHGARVAVRSPFDGQAVGEVHRAGPAELEWAIAVATTAAPRMAALPAHRRAAILQAVAAGIGRRREELARTIVAEAGKPLRFAYLEVDRAVETVTEAAELARRIEGELLPLDAYPPGEGRLGLVRRFPVGPVAAISPFNFPLNLACHKVAPALAAGCPVVLKPASQTPMTALLLAELVDQAGLPAGGLNVVPAPREVADALVGDPRLKLLTFTGSAEVGWALRARAGQKRVLLELGGNAAAVVEPDADIPRVAARLALGAFYYAGQSCISVQRVYAQRSIYPTLREALVEAARTQIPTGDPASPDTVCGPLIDDGNASRILEWTERAVAAGAERLCGGERRGNVVSPTVLTHVDQRAELSCQEAFGPVVLVEPYDDFEEALRLVNDSAFGLQAGVFTRDIGKLWRAFETIEVGAVIHDDYPSFRVDHMPYGGVKDSGFGREGPRYALEEMTERRMLVLRVGGP